MPYKRSIQNSEISRNTGLDLGEKIKLKTFYVSYIFLNLTFNPLTPEFSLKF